MTLTTYDLVDFKSLCALVVREGLITEAEIDNMLAATCSENGVATKLRTLFYNSEAYRRMVGNGEYVANSRAYLRADK